MEEKKKNNLFLKVLLILFLIYISLYIMNNLGYYNIASKNKIITEEKIKEFEADVRNGKSIDIKEYVRDTTNYKNTYSNLGYNISIGIDNVLNKGLKKAGKILKKLFQ